MTDRNSGEALVHHHMLPGAGRRSNDSGRGGGNGGATEGDGADFCGRPHRGPGDDG